MGNVVSANLDESKRQLITARTGKVMAEFTQLYERQYPVALFNKMRFDLEANGGPQSQLLQRKAPLEDKSIFSGNLFQYLEENKKWRNRFFFIPDSHVVNYYENKLAHERGLHPKGTINCAGYRVLSSVEKYLELLETTLPGVKPKPGSSPGLKCATQFPILLWHPYARHQYFCVTTEKEQQKWLAVFQDCVRHCNNGLSEECKVQTPAFTDSVRLHRQAHDQYSTWEMMCGTPQQILANLVMETLVPELREPIAARLKGKPFEKQRNWMLISDAVYSMVQGQVRAQYEAVVQKCEASRPLQEASIRTDMDQIITSKEHVTNKISTLVMPKAEKLLKASIQPYINSILEALMEPTSRGFSEVREVFFRELVEMSKNTLNGGSKEKLGEQMERISMLAFHPVKMQSCYEKVENLHLEGLQQRFDVSSTSVFVQRAQILMREQMDNAVYTFEQLLHQSMEGQGGEDLCKTIQRCQDRVIKKYDYDSSTVRKKFFREALLQIFIPYMLKQLTPTVAPELPKFKDLIFEDFSRFILVENIFEEVVLQSIMKDIMMAVKEAAVQRRHNLYRDSIVLTNSDPNLLLLADSTPIDWGSQYGNEKDRMDGSEPQKRRKQVVSMIQLDGTQLLPHESCLEVPGVCDISEEGQDGDSTVPASSGPHQDKAVPLTNGTSQPEGSLEKAIAPTPQETQPGPSKAEPQQEEAKKPEGHVEGSPQDAAIESAIMEIENAVSGEELLSEDEGQELAKVVSITPEAHGQMAEGPQTTVPKPAATDLHPHGNTSDSAHKNEEAGAKSVSEGQITDHSNLVTGEGVSGGQSTSCPAAGGEV
ncbi:protein Niban 2b [Brienomyrus brachyistius]|uniref:protein Niban 2b n=1 Tax=Brienomyrus brachyistius TaxID=42636 RepID=UPI0020B36412|nr:protein Niban 2b [Brienomyrus brachyistius]